MRQVCGGQPDINKGEIVSRWGEAWERDEGRHAKTNKWCLEYIYRWYFGPNRACRNPGVEQKQLSPRLTEQEETKYLLTKYLVLTLWVTLVSSRQIIHKSRLSEFHSRGEMWPKSPGLKILSLLTKRKRETPTEFLHELCPQGINVHCWIFSRCYLNNLKCGFYVSVANSNSSSPPWLRPFGADLMEDAAKNQERIHARVRGAGAKWSRSAAQEEKKKWNHYTKFVWHKPQLLARQAFCKSIMAFG